MTSLAPRRPWVAALEGYYGPPLPPADRTELVGWLAGQGYDAYVYSPKDDPYQRARWRDPYPAAERAALAELASACRADAIVRRENLTDLLVDRVLGLL